MASKAEPKDSRPDLGPYPAMHPYPGFTPCPGCGGRRAWETKDGRGWVSPMGQTHQCAKTRKHQAAIDAAWLKQEDGSWQLGCQEPTQPAQAA